MSPPHRLSPLASSQPVTRQSASLQGTVTTVTTVTTLSRKDGKEGGQVLGGDERFCERSRSTRDTRDTRDVGLNIGEFVSPASDSTGDRTVASGDRERPDAPTLPWWESPSFSLPSWLAELDAVGVDVAFDPPRLVPRTSRSVPAWCCSDFYALVTNGVLGPP
jgi:hypothetical protein